MSNLTRLTSNGNSISAAVSPDGAFVAYILNDEGRQSIWLKNVATHSDVQILPPAEETSFDNLTFSSNGNYIYYSSNGTLYQLPILGSLPKAIIQDFGVSRLHNSITFSPDGKQFAFIRTSTEGEERASLIIANSDGTSERILASSKRPELFLRPATWLPDGKTIVVVISAGAINKVVAIQIADGSVSPVPSPDWSTISQIVWQPNGQGLFVIATEGRSSIWRQVWSLSYPNGAAQNITNDFNNYQSISLTADGRGLAAVRIEQSPYI
jgi:Tol biopolymer transport system component